LQVWFHPLTEGVFADTLCIVNNSENHPLLEIPFSGRGYRLHASFSYDPISGDVPLTVTFTDTSTEDIIQWDWDFGDGNTSSQQNPVHIFEVEGVYAVELTISDGIHFDSVSHPVEVIAHALMSYSGEPSYNFGIVYLGDTSDMITLTLQSSGTDTLYVHDIRWKNNSHGFYYSFGDYSTPILPGNAASIDVWFQPSLQGAFSDSLIIETNAENLPVLKVKFSGRGEYVPPKPPENVTILMAGYNAVISWDAVTQTIYNTPFIPDCYLVFYNGSADPDNGPYYYLAATNDLSSTHFRVGEFAQYMFYRVIAYKSYNREHNDTLILNLQPGMTEKEVLEVLREL
ncbi:MAG: PKD domain-containing protein, partial [Candidatus Cloacimonadaceae bacterium]|nr:PKD domain-containing protein [Candidatus Cloacimonadaceae bacterium]